MLALFVPLLSTRLAELEGAAVRTVSELDTVFDEGREEPAGDAGDAELSGVWETSVMLVLADPRATDCASTELLLDTMILGCGSLSAAASLFGGWAAADVFGGVGMFSLCTVDCASFAVLVMSTARGGSVC